MRRNCNGAGIVRPALFAAACCVVVCAQCAEPRYRITLDVSDTPHLKTWAEHARDLAAEWYPRICNLLPTKGFTPPRHVILRFKKTDKGIAGTAGSVITVCSHWVEEHPDDVGFVIHELVHVVQNYGDCGGPWWVTEGIADYIRWAIFEGKPQDWFPRPRKPGGWKDGYRTTAGFFLWLESDKAPGIVKKLNTAMRRRAWSDAIFQKETGESLDALWAEYVGLKSAGAAGGKAAGAAQRRKPPPPG